MELETGGQNGKHRQGRIAAVRAEWLLVIEVDVQMNYQPLLPGFGTEGLIASTLRVQVR